MPRLLLLALLFAAPALAAEKPLNLLILTADDMNADSPGYMGNKLKVTPSLDAFAVTCYRFEHGHVSAPICQPSRSALMTGRVPHRNGALGFHPINKDVPTLVELLAAKGYLTAVVNKVPHMAPRQKFDWHLTVNGSGKNPQAFGRHVAEAIKYATDKGKPFFLNANITDPHRPFPGGVRAKKKEIDQSRIDPIDPKDVTVPAFLEDVRSVRKEVAQYFAGVRRFDQSFGAAMKALKDAGREKDTVVVFLSDHGMSFPFSKATVYRNGTWSPILLRWPGLAKPGVDRDHLVSSVDVLPTVLELLGIAAPAGFDGRSLLPLIKGEKQADRDFVITHVNTVSSGRAFPGRCVRTKTRSYIWYAWPDGKTTFKVEAMGGISFKALLDEGARDPRIKARVNQYLHGVVQGLYDLEKDADERVNVIAEEKYKADRDRLRKLLLAHMEKTNDPQLAAFRKLLP